MEHRNAPGQHVGGRAAAQFPRTRSRQNETSDAAINQILNRIQKTRHLLHLIQYDQGRQIAIHLQRFDFSA
jgi:hypothetical protein